MVGLYRGPMGIESQPQGAFSFESTGLVPFPCNGPAPTFQNVRSIIVVPRRLLSKQIHAPFEVVPPPARGCVSNAVEASGRCA